MNEEFLSQTQIEHLISRVCHIGAAYGKTQSQTHVNYIPMGRALMSGIQF